MKALTTAIDAGHKEKPVLGCFRNVQSVVCEVLSRLPARHGLPTCGATDTPRDLGIWLIGLWYLLTCMIGARAFSLLTKGQVF